MFSLAYDLFRSYDQYCFVVNHLSGKEPILMLHRLRQRLRIDDRKEIFNLYLKKFVRLRFLEFSLKS